MSKNHITLTPYVPSPTTGYIVDIQVAQPQATGPQPSLTSTHDGFVMLTNNDQFYSENFAYTFQSIVTTGVTNSAIVTNVVANVTKSGYSSPAPSSSYAFHLQSLLIQRQIAWDWPLAIGTVVEESPAELVVEDLFII
jgi:hypothetical protein